MPLTPEQEALKQAAMQFKVHGMFTTSHGRFNELANVDAIIELFSDLAQCNEDYGQAVDSVAQLQEEVFEVHRLLAAEKLRADQGWERYEMANRSRQATENQLAAISQLEAQVAPAALICDKCGVDRGKDFCPSEHWQACGFAGVAHKVPAQMGIKEAALQFLADQAQELGMGYGEAVQEALDEDSILLPNDLTRDEAREFIVSHAEQQRKAAAFRAHLKASSEIVKNWPSWKRDIWPKHEAPPGFADGGADGISQPVQADTDKLLTIIASAYQIAGAHDAPAHILDVLADPEQATVEHVEAMLPYRPEQAVPEHIKYRWNIERQTDGSLLICENDHEKGEKCEYLRYVPSSRQPVQAVPDAIRRAGFKMSNVMFNLSQAKDGPNAKLYGELCKEWDAAILSLRVPPGGPSQ